MSFGALKTLKLERTLGDAVLSITKQVPTDADESIEFDHLDHSIINAANRLRDYTPDVIPPVIDKAENKTVNNYPTIKQAEKKAVTSEDAPEKPKSRGRGRPKAKEKVEEKAKEKVEEKTDSQPAKTVALASQDDKTDLVKMFQTTFENEIGFNSEDTYMDEFNTFMTSLISMDYKSFLEAEITVAQIKTFKDLI